MSDPGRDSETPSSLADALVKDLTVLINHTHLGPSAVRDLEEIKKKTKKKTNGDLMRQTFVKLPLKRTKNRRG